MTKKETDLIIDNLNKSKDELLKAVAIVKANYHELCNLKDMRIAKLEKENKKLKNKKKLDKNICKQLGLNKNSSVSEQIVQTTHHWLDVCEKLSEAKKLLDYFMTNENAMCISREIRERTTRLLESIEE